jgi:hypothetical protein
MEQTIATVSTRAGALMITRAALDDIPKVIDIQAEAAAWLRSRGIEQWHIDHARTTAYLQAAMAGYPAARAVYLAWSAGPAKGGPADGEPAVSHATEAMSEPVATLALQAEDTRIWGEQPGDALYLHGCAVCRVAGGQGVGLALLRWAEGGAAAAGRTYLRLDCMAQNPELRAYYVRAGYAHRGDVRGQGWSASLNEKRVMEEEDMAR